MSRELKKKKLSNLKFSKIIEELWDSEWRFRQLFLFSPIAMMMIDSGGSINYINHKFIELFGFDLDNPPTMKQWLFLSFPIKEQREKVEAKWQKSIKQAWKKSKNSEPIKVEILCQDKQIRFLEINFTAFSRIVAVTFTDLTEYKKIDDMKTEFVSLASHQLRTPLGGLRWTLEMLINGDLGALPEEAYNAIRKVYDSNQYLIRLVNDLLNISRIEQQKIFNQPRLINIRNVLQESIDTVVSNSQPEVRQLIKFKLKHRPPQIKIDRNLLKEVCVNLLSNAVKYSYMGTPIILELKKYRDYIQLRIGNQGIGIPMEDQKKIFSKLFRANNALKCKTVGSGLGLYVVKSYVESWGGRVWFDSKQDQGANFYFTIPLKTSKKSRK